MQNVNMSLLPLGTFPFHGLRKLNQIYVDKTDLIFELASTRDKIFLARPRRFGKTLLTSTFESLFKNGLKDFEGLAIEKLWKDKTYNVVHLDFSEINEFSDITSFQTKFDNHLITQFGLLGFSLQNNMPVVTQLAVWLQELPANSLVYLIDEYDAPLTACIHNKGMFESVRSILSEFFKTLKSKDGCMRFFFMTGITKYSSTGIFSGFNVFTDISLKTRYATLIGWTEEEIKSYFADYLENASRTLSLPIDRLMDKMREQYDGFCFDAKASAHVYCPWSVLNFLKYPEEGFENYWYDSAGQPSALINYIKNHKLEDPASYSQDKRIRLNLLKTSCDYDSLNAAVLLTQAGYLTIKSINASQVVRLGYPNQEVSVSMAELYADKLLNNQALDLPDSIDLSSLFSKGEVSSVIDQLNLVVNSIDYKNYPITNEALCRAFVQVLLIGAALVPHVELHSALGRSDLEVDAGDLHWVFEFKYAQTLLDVPSCLSDAKEQIKSRRYGETLHGKKLIRIALVFCAEKRQFAAFEEI